MPSYGFKVIALRQRKSADWVNLTSASTEELQFSDPVCRALIAFTEALRLHALG